MNYTWWLIIYFHASGTVMGLADFGNDKPHCDQIAASYNKGHDTGIQTYVCVPQAKPAPATGPTPSKAAPVLPAGIDLRSFILGVAAGEGSK